MAGDQQADNTVPNSLFSGGTHSTFACNACKKKKIKCDRVAPQCSNCIKANRSCEYPLSVPKPGPKAGYTNRKRHHDSAKDNQTSQSAKVHPNTDNSGNVINNSLSAIVHPKHQNVADNEGHLLDGQTSNGSTSSRGSALAQALKNMAISWKDCQTWLTRYFDNMTSFSLFHRPSFDRKLASITNALELEALLTAMIAFAKTFGPVGEPSAIRNLPVHAIWHRALSVTNDCLHEYNDETPPLHVLQALLLVTWNQLCMGVRSRGWRSLGECVRICYELRLHEEDVDTRHSARSWIECEERRRAWYLAWHMDVFAGTIKRLPTMIDWYTNKTKLPVPDPDWFSGAGSPSCLLLTEPSERWKVLEKSGNACGLAWFIVISSYKYEAYLLSTNPQSSYIRYAQNERGTPEAIRRHRDMLINCVHCAQLAVPDKFTLGDRILTFEPADLVDDSWCYMIHQIIQVTKFMLYRLDILFLPQNKRVGSKLFKTTQIPSKLAWEQLIALGGQTARLLRNTAQCHIKWVNPFVVNAVWFSAAALVVGQVLGPSTLDKQYLNSNFDLLRATVKEFVKVSKVPETLVSSLDTLEENLRALTDERVVMSESNGRMSSVSVSGSRSPLPTDTDTLTHTTPKSDAVFDAPSPPVPPASNDNSGQLQDGLELGYFDTPGLDMTQVFSDLDALWTNTTDRAFNFDYFRCPYE